MLGVLNYNHFKLYNQFKNHANYVIPQNTTGTLTLDKTVSGLLGLSSATNKWHGGVLVGDIIYGSPYTAKEILRIDTTNDTWTTVASTELTAMFPSSNPNLITGGVYINGYVFWMRYGGTEVVRFDPETFELKNIPNPIYTAGDSSYGFIAAKTGWIYMIPLTGRVLKFHPETEEFVYVTASLGTDLWNGGVLTRSGIILGCPRNAGSVLKIDPETDTVTTFGSVGARWNSPTLGPNGDLMYCAPHNDPDWLVVDGDNETFTKYAIGGTRHSNGSFMLPDGRIYNVPENNDTQNTWIDTVDNSVGSYPIFSDAMNLYRHMGGVSAPNGAAYFIPRDYTIIVKATISGMNVPFDKEFLSSPYFNNHR